MYNKVVVTIIFTIITALISIGEFIIEDGVEELPLILMAIALVFLFFLYQYIC